MNKTLTLEIESEQEYKNILLKEQCKGLELFEIVTVIKELSSLEAALKWSTHPRVLLETTLIKLCENRLDREMPGIGENPAA